MLNTAIIKKWEGLRLNAYRDVVGIPTIGYGNTFYRDGTKVKLGDRLASEAEASKLLDLIIENDFLPVLRKEIKTWDQMNLNQQSAVLSFAYNLGAHFYGNPGFNSITKLLSTPANWTNKQHVHRVFGLYSRAGGKRLKGLVRRRSDEAALFLKPGEKVEPSKPKASIMIALYDTLLKKEPKDSSSPEAFARVSVEKGHAFYVDEILDEQRGHTQVKLGYEAGNWWIYNPHWRFEAD